MQEPEQVFLIYRKWSVSDIMDGYGVLVSRILLILSLSENKK